MERLRTQPCCPSLLEITQCEAGELAPVPQAMLRAHAADCARCGGILSLIECARLTLLGGTAGARYAHAYRAAARLVTLVERRDVARS